MSLYYNHQVNVCSAKLKIIRHELGSNLDIYTTEEGHNKP